MGVVPAGEEEERFVFLKAVDDAWWLGMRRRSGIRRGGGGPWLLEVVGRAWVGTGSHKVDMRIARHTHPTARHHFVVVTGLEEELWPALNEVVDRDCGCEACRRWVDDEVHGQRSLRRNGGTIRFSGGRKGRCDYAQLSLNFEIEEKVGCLSSGL